MPALSWLPEDLALASEHLLDCARTYCPSRTGRARRALVMQQGAMRAVLVGPAYLRYTLKDIAPHVIQPRSARALFWPAAPEGHPWARVHHPGSRANPWTREARNDAIKRMHPVLQQAGRRLVSELKARIAA